MSKTIAVFVSHSPWFAVHEEARPSGARDAIAAGVYGSHLMSEASSVSKSRTNCGYARLTAPCAQWYCRGEKHYQLERKRLIWKNRRKAR